jgi:protocatechuate 3,4-dioxygenase beta subunit
MIELDEQRITEAVLAQLQGTPSPRLKEIVSAAVRHLHAFAREVALTRAEWLAGIEFLTAVGKACTPEHQEFILLSDTLGLTTLTNLIEARTGAPESTLGSVLGPFYRADAPEMALGSNIARLRPGKEVQVYGRVVDPNGRPIAGATVEVWVADDEGQYDVQAHGPGVDDLRARFKAGDDGRYWFRSTQPRGYSVPMGGPVGKLIRATQRAGMRPAHIHFLIHAPGFRQLVTSVYFEDDEYLETDAAFGVMRELVIRVKPPDGDAPLRDLPSIRYDFQLTPVATPETAPA